MDKHAITLPQILFSAFLLCFATDIYAQTFGDMEEDTARTYELDMAVVQASPKEHLQLRQQPVAASSWDGEKLHTHGIEAAKGVSALTPNLYMPDYGSRLSSAVYVRGVGSRVGTPAVGLYVDNIPHADKTTYDFQLHDIARLDVLRGPQGTLYGRGAMGGLLRVFTADPSHHYGTDVRTGFSLREGGKYLATTTYLHPLPRVALSLGGFGRMARGFRHNRTTGSKADSNDAEGLRTRVVWTPADRWRLDYVATFQHHYERSNPYVLTEAQSDAYFPDRDGVRFPDLAGGISQNRQSTYRRRLFTTGLTAQGKLPHMLLTSVTAFQHLSDRLFMDQDYIGADIFSLDQQQRGQTWSEELALKGRLTLGGRGRETVWEWTAGAFVLNENKRVTCPVGFYEDGIDYLNTIFRRSMPSFITLTFTDPALQFFARLRSVGTNAALFHESTLHHLFIEPLSLTLGLRLDYDRHGLKLNAPANTYNYRFTLQMPAFGLNLNEPLSVDAAFGGKNHASTLEWLPKVALSYTLPERLGNIYASVSKGYRSGGYNLENYSDLSQIVLRRNLMQQVRAYSIETISSLPSLTDESKRTAIAGMEGMMAAQMPAEVSVGQLAYKPEYTWSHEIGAHLSMLDEALQIDGAVFFQRTHDLQLARFSPSGMGREVVNAGSSKSYGLEIEARAKLLQERLRLHASYGYTRSTFTEYYLGQHQGLEVDYTGHHVPFAPTHTVFAGVEFRQPVNHAFFRAMAVGMDITGAGRVFWDEANTFSRPFCAQLAARFTMTLPHDVSVSFWGKNLTASRYTTFEFSSMSRHFVQYGVPLHGGVDIRIHF